MKYLKPSSLGLNLSDTTILSVSTESRSIACLDCFINFNIVKF